MGEPFGGCLELPVWGEMSSDPSPPLPGHRKPFPIGDKVTFSGKDCVCQNCSHTLLSTKPIKIHGPSRELTAVLGWGQTEGLCVPGEGGRTGFGDHCAALQSPG